MSVELPPTIYIDWKAPGEDYLHSFSEEYPDLPFLQEAPFSQLIDNMALEGPETVFDALSAFLVPFGYELWQSDTGSDSYSLFLLPRLGSADTKTWFTTEARKETEYAFIGRLGARAAQLLDIPRPAVSLPDVSLEENELEFTGPQGLIEDSVEHSHFGGMMIEATPIQLFYYKDGDNENVETVSLVDTHTWYYEFVDADGFYDDPSFDYMHPLYGTQAQTFWHYYGSESSDSVYVISDYQTPVFQTWGGESFGKDYLGVYAGIEDTFFYILHGEPVEPAKGILRLLKRLFGVSLPRLMKASVGKTKCVMRFKRAPDYLLPLSDAEVVAVFAYDVDGIPPSFSLINVKKGKAKRLWIPPVRYIGGPFLINADTIGFFEAVPSDAPIVANFEPVICYFWVYNWRLHTYKRAKLDGLGNVFQAPIVAADGKTFSTHVVEGFFGHIKVLKGHEDWFILNYNSDYDSMTALAWLWNAATNDVVKVTSSQFPGEEPELYYVATLDLYFANHERRVDKLVPFEELQEKCDVGQLVWETI